MPAHQQEAATWHFPRKECCSNYAPDELLQTFNEYKLSGLVRENIQNSLDARRPDCAVVKVSITTGSISTDALPHLHELQKHIAVLQGKNEQIKKKIAVMQQVITEPETRYISFEDSNTTGISAKNWEAYAYSKGWHPTLDSRADESRRGGSHGVGKIASNAASELNLAYFINRNESGACQYGATVELVDHSLEDENHDRTGLLAIRRGEHKGLSKSLKNASFTAIDNKLTHPLFQKSERGLKIVIPFVRQSYFDLNQPKRSTRIDDTRQIIRAVSDSFFIALLKGELEVDINGTTLNQATLHQHISDFFPLDHRSNSRKIKTNYTRYYVEAYQSGKKISIEVKGKTGINYRFAYHLLQDSNIEPPCGCSTVVRRMGMSVHTSPFTCSSLPFCGVLIPESEEEDSFLKSMENKSHTQLDSKMLDESEEQKNAQYFLNRLQEAIAASIHKELQRDVSESELLDTSDIFYSRSTQGISSVLKKTKQQIKSKDKTMTISAVGETVPCEELDNTYTDEHDEDAPEGDEQDADGEEQPSPYLPSPSSGEGAKEAAPPAHPTLGAPDGQGRKRRHYAMRERSVDRLVAHGEDDIELRVNTSGQSKPCRVRFTPINGEGKKEGQSLNLQQIYQSIIPSDALDTPDAPPEPASFCAEQPDAIDTHIINNRVTLRLRFHAQANQNLKYEFVVEH